MEPDCFQCIECGHPALETHTKLGDKSIIKITHCEKCESVVDKYIEYDPVIIYLDAMLLKLPVYRHILINQHKIQTGKLFLLLLLFDAFTKWMLEQSAFVNKKLEPERVFYAALEFDLYWKYFLSSIQWLIQFGVLLCFITLQELHKVNKTSRMLVLKSLVISNFGKILIIPALLWAQGYSIIYLILGKLFVIASNIQALRAILCDNSKVTVTNLVIVTVISAVLQESIVLYLPKTINSTGLWFL